MNEILDDIQEDLHERGKQLMVKTFNNKTEKIKFLQNKSNQNNQNMDLNDIDKDNNENEMELMQQKSYAL